MSFPKEHKLKYIDIMSTGYSTCCTLSAKTNEQTNTCDDVDWIWIEVSSVMEVLVLFFNVHV